MKTCIDVGANYGQEMEEFLLEGFIVYAFEPVPRLIEHLKTYFKNYEGFRPVPMAADIENHWTIFRENTTTACSSIYEFAPNVAEKWHEEERIDFVTVDRYPVMTIRLDTFMNIYNIGEVDYLWIDAQGNDFNVLRSLGERIKDVKEGKCEAALATDLYTNTDNKATSIIIWLREHGFICNLVPHNHKNEADIYFKRPC